MTLIKIMFVAVICTPIFALGCFLITKIADQIGKR